MIKKILKLFKKHNESATADAAQAKPFTPRGEGLILSSQEYAAPERGEYTPQEIKRMYQPPRTLARPSAELAQDNAPGGDITCGGFYGVAAGLASGLQLTPSAFPAFPGYAFLSGLTQNALIRAGVETIADEMTREWLELSRAGGTGQRDKDDATIQALTEAAEKYKLKDVFHRAAELCGYFGGCLVYMDTGARGEELQEPLYLDPLLFRRGTLRRFVPVEPINISPVSYNSLDPLKSDYFEPQEWWILSQRVHSSRFLKFVINEPSTLLKPAYNFFGVSTAQLAWDYVRHFTEDRESASRLLNKFSLTVFQTDLTALLSGGSDADINMRVQYLVQRRSNDGILLTDKESENILQINTPLSGVTDITRQALELLAAVFRIPAVKLLGISPAGFNATGESDLRNYYDHIKSQQEKLFRGAFQKVLDILQLNIFGQIDRAITFNFRPLGGDDETTRANINMLKIQSDAAAIAAGIISPEEARARIAKDPASGFDNIDPDDVPPRPEGEYSDETRVDINETSAI